MAAPALAASMADCAICSGVTGTAGLRPGVSADPVTAHEIITLRCMPPPCAYDLVSRKPTARMGPKPRGPIRRAGAGAGQADADRRRGEKACPAAVGPPSRPTPELPFVTASFA